MADSIREQIVKAALAALNAPVGKPATAVRSRIDAYSEVEMPAIGITPELEDVDRSSKDVAYRKLRLRVGILVKATGAADAAADTVIQHVITSLYADESLGGLALQIAEEKLVWEFEPSLNDVCSVQMDFQVAYTTKVADPLTKGL